MEDGRRRDYGACVPDVEPEERVTLEEDPAETTTTTKAKKSKTAARKKSRRLTDEERANLLATHHTHVMCVFARARRNSNPSGRCVRPRYPLSTPTCETRATTRGTGAKCSARDARRTARPFRDGCARRRRRAARATPRRLYSGTENARPRRTHPRRCRTSSRFTTISARETSRASTRSRFRRRCIIERRIGSGGKKLRRSPSARVETPWREIARQRCERC